MVVRYPRSQSRCHSGVAGTYCGSLFSRSTAPHLSKFSGRHSGFQAKPNVSDCSAQLSFWLLEAP
eukprot:2094491-Amphidinium_carterae.1